MRTVRRVGWLLFLLTLVALIATPVVSADAPAPTTFVAVLSAGEEIPPCAAATDATDAPNAFAKRSKNATAMRVSILENGRLPA